MFGQNKYELRTLYLSVLHVCAGGRLKSQILIITIRWEPKQVG